MSDNQSENSQSSHSTNVSGSAPNHRLALRMGHPSTKTSMEAECDHDFVTMESNVTPYRSAENHFKRAFTHLNQLRKRRLLFDVTLISGSMELPAHKAVLAACSSYFSAMFTSTLAESTANTVSIQGVDADALQMLVDFMYTGEVQVTEDTVQLLLPAANLLQLHEVQEACCEFLQSQLHPSNCIGIQKFAEVHDCAELAAYAKQFIEQHFNEVLQYDDEFLTLSEHDMDRLLSSDRLAVTEEELLEAVMRWVDHLPLERATAGSRLLRRIRYPILSREFLIRISSSHRSPSATLSVTAGGPSLATSSRTVPSSNYKISTHFFHWGHDFLIEAMRYHLMSQEDRINHQLQMFHLKASGGDISDEAGPSGGDINRGLLRGSSYSCIESSSSSVMMSHSVLSGLELYRPRVPLATPKCLLVIGGQAPKAIRTVECYDFKTGKWYTLPEMPRRLCRCGVAVLNDVIYVIGGFNGVQRQMSCEKYEPKENRWSSLANMNMRRSTVGVAVIRQKILAVGGFDGITGFASSEWYDPETDQWELIPSMHKRRSSVGVAVLEDRYIYSVGGYDGSTRQCLSSVERFDAEANTWQSVADMHYARSGCGVTALGNKLLVVGGHDGPLVRNSVEMYDPVTDTWTLVANMHLCRRNSGVVTYNEYCYVVGGDDGSSNLNSIEYYDPKIDKWTLMTSNMPTGRSYAGTVIVERQLL